MALIARLVTSIPPMFLTLMLVMGLDMVSGGLRAASKRSRRKWDWEKSRVGAVKRGGAICVILLAGVIEQHVEVKGLPKGSFMTGVAAAYVCHYGLSMLNNVVALGVPVPKAMRVVLGKFSGDPETGGEDIIPAKEKGGTA